MKYQKLTCIWWICVLREVSGSNCLAIKCPIMPLLVQPSTEVCPMECGLLGGFFWQLPYIALISAEDGACVVYGKCSSLTVAWQNSY